MTLVREVHMTEAFEQLHISQALVMPLQSVIMFNDIISTDEGVVHGNEEVDRNVYEVVMV